MGILHASLQSNHWGLKVSEARNDQRQHISPQRPAAILRSVPRAVHRRKRVRQTLERKGSALLLLLRACRFWLGADVCGCCRTRGKESIMRRCDHWGGKFDLAAHRKWRLRLCTLACKNSQEPRRHEDSQHRRRWLDACGLKLVAAAILRRFRATREQVGFGVLALNLICNPVEAYCALEFLGFHLS